MCSSIADAASSRAQQLLRAIDSQFTVLAGRAEKVEEGCRQLAELLRQHPVPALRETIHRQLNSILQRHRGPLCSLLFDFLVEQTEKVDDGRPLWAAMLSARDPQIRRRVLETVLERVEAGRLIPDVALSLRVAKLLDDEDSPLSDDALLARTGGLLWAMPYTELPVQASNPIEALLASPERPLRALAARLLDLDGMRVSLTRASRLLGPEAARRLTPLFDFTRATHRDVAELATRPGHPPPCLPSLMEAEATLGRTLLGELIGRLGWASVGWGIQVETLTGVSVGGSLPYVLRPEEASLLGEGDEIRRLWTRHLVTAHGGVTGGDDARGRDEETVQCFRRYNLAHAEALSLFLEPVALTVGRVRRLLELLDRIVDDFARLFSRFSEDAAGLPEHYERLRRSVVAGIGELDAKAAVPAEISRLVQAFEDPRSIDEIRTLHGLKRHLHQRGLRLAFRLFRSSGSANRTVDLALCSNERVSGALRKIRYLDFEPSASDPTALPLPVRQAVDAYGRQLLLGREDLPEIEILAYGNEVQVYIQFRNHPVFLRIDYSPPLQGGMIDLEYYAVSQYELEHHPDLSLPGIQIFFRRLEFDVEADGLHLHARYDKERALELGELLEKAQIVFQLIPYLMDVDWTIGGLELPPTARKTVASAWVERLVRDGAIPVDELLSADRRHVLRQRISEPAGEREVVWDGRGEYEDRFSRTPPPDFGTRLGARLVAAGLAEFAHRERFEGRCPGQISLENGLLRPLRAALRRGELSAEDGELRPTPSDRFQREHEVHRLALLLEEGGAELARAMRMASLVDAVERHLRFVTTGGIQGHEVQRAALPLRGERPCLFVLRDAAGIARVALASGEETLYRKRPRPEAPWEENPTLDPEDLAQRLRANNYLNEAGLTQASEADSDPQELAAAFHTPNPIAPPHPLPGDRILPAVVAAPGRATGFVRFGVDGRAPEDFDGAVLVAPTIRPEDTPLLCRAAAIVSTGGGILSHAGLTALELRKPSVIVAGMWQRPADGSIALRYRRLEFREEEREQGGYRLSLRRDLREREELLHEGDLVVVDAEAGLLSNLGQDRDALALHQELHLLARAEERLAHPVPPTDLLSERGHLLRALHQLEKIVARIDRPLLVRFAVVELLRGQGGSAGRDRRKRLVGALCAHPTAGPTARAALARQLRETRERARALAREAVSTLPHSESLPEILLLRLRARQAAQRARAFDEVARLCQLDLPDDAAPADVEEPTRRRLESLLALWRGQPDPTLARMEDMARLERLLAVASLPSQAAAREHALESRRERCKRVAGRRILHPEDGGAELTPLVGAKAAQLSEIAAVLPHGEVPAWFALSQASFREMLRAPIGAGVEALGLRASGERSVGDLIAELLERSDGDERERAVAIQHLWRNAPLSEDLRDEIVEAYRGLGGEEPEPFVAIRSSALEEDTPEETWAGQFDTFLFIRGEQALLEHLRRAWAGLWNERALHGRRARGLEEAAGGGLLVQRMVRARLSGVIHTSSVATGQLREIVINVGLGLGEGVVSGQVEVDQICISKEDLGRDPLRFRYRVGDKRLQVAFDDTRGQGTRLVETLYHQRLRPALEYAELCELVQTAHALERSWGHPLDIEFAYEDHRLQLLQVRPIPIFQLALEETLNRFPLASRTGEKATENRS